MAEKRPVFFFRCPADVPCSSAYSCRPPGLRCAAVITCSGPDRRPFGVEAVRDLGHYFPTPMIPFSLLLGADRRKRLNARPHVGSAAFAGAPACLTARCPSGSSRRRWRRSARLIAGAIQAAPAGVPAPRSSRRWHPSSCSTVIMPVRRTGLGRGCGAGVVPDCCAGGKPVLGRPVPTIEARATGAASRSG